MMIRFLAVAIPVTLASAALAQGKPSLPRGLFAVSDAQCQAAHNGTENGARHISKDGKTLESYAGTCKVRSSVQKGATFTLVTQCEGESQTETLVITVIDRKTLKWAEGDANWTLKSCD